MEIDKSLFKGDFFEYFEKKGLLDQAIEEAYKEILIEQIEDLMKERKMTKTALAKELETSRASLDRFLDPTNDSFTFKTLLKIANVFDKKLVLHLEDK